MFTNLKDKIKNLSKIVILTGAGISSESGIHTYRTDEEGSIWKRYNPDEVASIEGFEDNPYKCWEFYNELIDELNGKLPNKAHLAITKLQQNLKHVPVYIITQNVDNLHTKAHSNNVYEVHGTMSMYKCNSCGRIYNQVDYLTSYNNVPVCPECKGFIRPNIVMFGEIPHHVMEIENIIKGTDCFLYGREDNQFYDGDKLFIQIGTSALISPVSGFATMAKRSGYTNVYVDLTHPDNYRMFDIDLKGNCVDIVPKLVDFLIENCKR
jgi:NAD-dependent deacetylase